MAVRPSYKMTMGYVPQQGSRALSVLLAFNTLATQSINDDLTNEQAQGQIEFVQSVYIDNADNAQKFTLQILEGNVQRIVAKANTQGYYPLIAPNGKLSYSASTTGNVNINIIWMNIFVNTIVWPTQ